MANLTPIYVRGANPVWIFRDLQGNPLDDTYYAHFLTNELPFVPQPPFDSPFTTANPITGGIVQFQANGALQNNLYFDPDLVYRIEVRQGPTQADPLLYAVENYVADEGSGGGGDINIISNNLIQNPQFVKTLFEDSYSETGSNLTINVAPDWDIVTTGGSGTVSVSLQTVTADQNLPGQAPQFLRITTSGSFTSVRLKQRFDNNGSLFYSTPDQQRAVSCFVAAKTTSGTPQISAVLRSSSDNADVTLLTVSLNTAWQSFTGGSGFLPESDNTDSNEDAFIDFDIDLPTAGVVDITSLQLTSQTNLQQPSFSRSSTEQQKNELWHFYRDEVIIKPKQTILTAWNFPLNPWQFRNSTLSVASSVSQYTADQTILVQQNANALSIGRASAARRRELEIQARSAGSANNRFAIIQYIDPKIIRAYWSYFVSSLVRARVVTSHGTSVGIKMRLIYRSTLPSALGANEPIVNSSWSDPDPTFSAGWTAIAPKNDPVYTLPNSNSPETPGANALPAFSFDEFELPQQVNDTMVLGIVLYTTGNISNVSTEDAILIDKISLVPNRFAVDASPQSFEQTLQECEYYYEKSYPIDVVPSSASTLNALVRPQIIFPNPDTTTSGTLDLFGKKWGLQYKTRKRTSSVNAVFYAVDGTQNTVTGVIWNNGAAILSNNLAIGNWTVDGEADGGLSFNATTTTALMTSGVVTRTRQDGFIEFQYTVDARLGV